MSLRLASFALAIGYLVFLFLLGGVAPVALYLDAWHPLFGLAVWLGFLASAVYLIGAPVIAILRLRTLPDLSAFDTERAAGAGGDPSQLRQARRLLRRWCAAPVDEAIDAESRELLNRFGQGQDRLPEFRSVLGKRRSLARRTVGEAALRAGILAALSPSPTLDAISVWTIQVRLVSRLCAIHGFRPGYLGLAWIFGLVLISTAAARVLPGLPIGRLTAEAVADALPRKGLETGSSIPILGNLFRPLAQSLAEGFSAILSTSLVGLVTLRILESGLKPIRGDALASVRREARSFVAEPFAALKRRIRNPVETPAG